MVRWYALVKLSFLGSQVCTYRPPPVGVCCRLWLWAGKVKSPFPSPLTSLLHCASNLHLVNTATLAPKCTNFILDRLTDPTCSLTTVSLFFSLLRLAHVSRHSKTLRSPCRRVQRFGLPGFLRCMRICRNFGAALDLMPITRTFFSVTARRC